MIKSDIVQLNKLNKPNKLMGLMGLMVMGLFFIFFIFCNYALAVPSLVVGDIESLPLLTYTPYLEGHPVLFFTQQLSAENVAHLLKKNKNIVFAESNFMDLVLSIAEDCYRHEMPDRGEPLSFRVEEEDTYEVWGMREEKVEEIILDGKIVKEEDKDEGIIWRRLIREKLKKGEHTLSIEGQINEVIIIPCEKIEEYVEKSKSLVENRENDLAYIVSGENSEGIMKRSLSLYKDSDYNIKVKVSKNLSKIKNSGLYLKMGEPSEKENWLFSSSNTNYSLFPSSESLIFLTYFNGNSQEDEFVQMKREEIRVDLKRYPYLKLVYKLSEANAQTMDIVGGIDFTGNGRVDEEVSLRKEIILEDWEKIAPGNETMDFYETHLPSEWPKGYTTEYPSRERFIVYKNRVPLETTWGEWADYKELVEIGVKKSNRLVVAVPKGESPKESEYRVSYLPGIRESREFKGFSQLETNLKEIFKEKFSYKENCSLVNLKLKLRKVPGLDCSGREKTYKYYLKNIELYSNLAVIIPVWKSDFKEKIRYESKNVANYNYLVSAKGGALINCYFDGKAKEEEYVKLDIPVSGYSVNKYPFLDIAYKVDDTLVQAIDCKIGVDFTEDGVLDKEISLRGRKRIVLDKWEKSIPGNKTMDFYETHLPSEWPKEYTTRYPSLEKFMVYKNGIPMRTTWCKWPDYQELMEIGGGEYNRLVITVPKGISPEENVYTVSYFSFTGEVKSSAGFNQLQANLGERIREILPEKKSIKIVNFSLYLRKGERADCSGDKRGIYTFNIKGIKAYKISNLSLEEMLREDGALKDMPLFKVGKRAYSLKDLDKVEVESENLLGEVKDLHLLRGNYEFSSLKNETFKVDWFIMEPANLLSDDSRAKVEFRKVNPTRYTVYAEAKKSFWLVFSESFHKDWKAYVRKVEDESSGKEKRFEWSALITLLQDWGKRKEVKEHYLVNGYANGWWIPVEELSSDYTKNLEPDSQIKRVKIVLEFTPQRLFEIGIVISGVTFIFCIAYLVHSYLKKRRKRRA